MFLNVIGASSGRKLYRFVNTKTRTKKNVAHLTFQTKFSLVLFLVTFGSVIKLKWKLTAKN